MALDDYFAEREESVDFIKVDTQGAEALILAGMSELVRRSSDIVVAMEYSPRHLAGLGVADLSTPDETLGPSSSVPTLTVRLSRHRAEASDRRASLIRSDMRP